MRRLRREHGMEMIAPNRRRRKRTQDGRPLRRYLRRWKGERLFAEELSPDQQPLGTSRGQLSRDGSTRLRVDPLDASVRLVLGRVLQTVGAEPARAVLRPAGKRRTRCAACQTHWATR